MMAFEDKIKLQRSDKHIEVIMDHLRSHLDSPVRAAGDVVTIPRALLAEAVGTLHANIKDGERAIKL